MTKLKIDITFNSSCMLAVKDVTGFEEEGFLPEDAEPILGSYKLSDGYFLNAVIYNRYNCNSTIVNSGENLTYFKPEDVDPVYTNNFTQDIYHLKKDGVYTFKRLFIISKAYYLANIDSFTNTVIYFDPEESKFIKVGSPDNTVLTLKEVVSQININTTGLVTVYKFISTCYLNKCLYLLQSQILEKGLDSCNTGSDTYKKQRDYILMTLNVIDYLKQDGHLTEVQRVIESSNSCGLICKEIGDNSNTDCGCG